MAGDDEFARPHPKDRPVEPEDPMSLNSFEVTGDIELMLRCLVEEYARMGFGLEDLMKLCRDPEYQGTSGLLKFFGEDELRRRIAEILARSGVLRTTTRTTEPVSDRLVRIEPLDRT